MTQVFCFMAIQYSYPSLRVVVVLHFQSIGQRENVERSLCGSCHYGRRSNPKGEDERIMRYFVNY